MPYFLPLFKEHDCLYHSFPVLCLIKHVLQYKVTSDISLNTLLERVFFFWFSIFHMYKIMHFIIHYSEGFLNNVRWQCAKLEVDL